MSQIVFADSNWILQRVRNRKSVSRKTINEEKKKAKKNETGQQRGIKGAVEEWSMQENEDNSTAFIQKWAVKKIKRAQTLRNRLRDAHQFIILGVSTSLQFVVVTNLSGRSHQWPLVLWRGVLLYKRELASCTASCGRAVCWCLLLWVKGGGGGGLWYGQAFDSEHRCVLLMVLSAQRVWPDPEVLSHCAFHPWPSAHAAVSSSPILQGPAHIPVVARLQPPQTRHSC